jgi:progressive ankylosis protein
MLLFWLPLAASWALMGAETPILQAAIARLSDMETQLAAFGIVMSLEIAIESPVIMLLATTTALATSRKNYLTLRRFMAWTNVVVTVAALLMTWGPLYSLVVRSIMGIPEKIAATAQPGMRIMILWSAAIGIRRFYQGVMIRNGRTRWVGYGTAARLFSSGGTGILLAAFTSWPGVYIGSVALMAGVSTEAVFATWAARGTVRRILDEAGGDDRDTLSFWDVARYHTPLAATSLLTLLAQPVIGAGLARMPNPEQNLAAWPIVWSIVWIFRSPAYALPEAVIALVSARSPKDLIRKFCWSVGFGSLAALLVFIFTPLVRVYLRYVAWLPESLSRDVLPGLVLGLGLPLINAAHSWFRGVLMESRQTRVIYWGMGLNLVVTGVIIALGVLLQASGTIIGSIALTVAFLIEVYYLKVKVDNSAAMMQGSISS